MLIDIIPGFFRTDGYAALGRNEDNRSNQTP